jgi:hypothetical protein
VKRKNLLFSIEHGKGCPILHNVKGGKARTSMGIAAK